MIIELNRPDGKVGVQVIIYAATKCPGCAGAAGTNVFTEVSNAQQPVDKEVKLIHAVGDLRAEENVIFARRNAADGFVITAEISLQAEPVSQVAS